MQQDTASFQHINLQEEKKTNTAKSKHISLQDAIQQLLKSGLSYVQVWAKVQSCKSLFKKGTPEFYSCLGINLPKKPQQKSRHYYSQNQASVIPLEARRGDAVKMLLLAGIVLVAVFIFRDSYRRYNEEMRKGG